MARKRRESREPVTLDIQALTHEGKGIAEIDGKKIFVAGAMPGERVSAQIVKSRRSYSEAITLSVEVASAQRIQARCAAFGVCGGCSLQHLEHAAQVEHKQSVLLENLRRIGKLDVNELAVPILSPGWSYRRKARLGVKYVHKKERVLVGFRERLKPYIADMQRCEVLSSTLESLPETLAAFIGSLSICAQLPQVELAVADNAVALVFRVLQTPSAQDIELFAA
ncbi:MAG: TRAM domain-containing protein, partial [Pseudomonadota bacterium]